MRSLTVAFVTILSAASSCAEGGSPSPSAPSGLTASESCIRREAVQDGLSDIQLIVGEFSLDRAAEAAQTVASVADEVEEVSPEAAAKFRGAVAEFERVGEAREDEFDLAAALPHWAKAVRSVSQGVDELESLAPQAYC